MPAVRLMRLPQFTLRIAHDGGRAESYTLMLFKLTCGTLAGNAGHLFSVGEFRKRQRVWALGTWYLDHVAMPPSTPHQSICQPVTGVPNLRAQTVKISVGSLRPRVANSLTALSDPHTPPPA